MSDRDFHAETGRFSLVCAPGDELYEQPGWFLCDKVLDTEIYIGTNDDLMEVFNLLGDGVAWLMDDIPLERKEEEFDVEPF